MIEEIVGEPFDAAVEKVEAAHQQAVDDLRSRLERAKSEALKKLGS